MNDKIKELAEQAGYKPLPGFDFASSLEEAYIKKFAELIVKECVDVVEGGRFLHDQSPPAIFAKECSGAIKRHFGIG